MVILEMFYRLISAVAGMVWEGKPDKGYALSIFQMSVFVICFYRQQLVIGTLPVDILYNVYYVAVVIF